MMLYLLSAFYEHLSINSAFFESVMFFLSVLMFLFIRIGTVLAISGSFFP